MDVICPRCGTKNEAGKLTCGRCGGHLPIGPPVRKAADPQVPGQTRPPQAQPGAPPQQGKAAEPAPVQQATRKLNLIPPEHSNGKAAQPVRPASPPQPPVQKVPEPQGAAAAAKAQGPAPPGLTVPGQPDEAPKPAAIDGGPGPGQQKATVPPVPGTAVEEPPADEEAESLEQPDGRGQAQAGFIPAQLTPQQLAQIQAQQAALLQQQYAMMAQYPYAMPSPFWPPMGPFYPGMTGPFPMMPFAPPGMPPYGFPPQPMGPMAGPYAGYGQPMQQQPYGAPWQPGPGPGPGPTMGPGQWPPKKRHTGLIVTIVIIVVLLIAGGVTAAILLTRKTKSSFNLGSGSVIGASIEFTNLRLSQNGSSLTLTGSYKNSSKKKGTCTLTIQGVSGGTERMISFSIPISSGSSTTSFTQRKTSSAKLSGATLGPIVFNSSSPSINDSETSPWDSSPYGSETLPYESSPYDTSTSPGTSPSSSTTPSF